MRAAVFYEPHKPLRIEDVRARNVAKGQYFVLPKGVKHKASFKTLTITLAGVYEKGL